MFLKGIGALLHSNCSKMPPLGSLFSDRNGEMGLDGAIEILGPPRSKREAPIFSERSEELFLFGHPPACKPPSSNMRASITYFYGVQQKYVAKQFF